MFLPLYKAPIPLRFLAAKAFAPRRSRLQDTASNMGECMSCLIIWFEMVVRLLSVGLSLSDLWPVHHCSSVPPNSTGDDRIASNILRWEGLARAIAHFSPVPGEVNGNFQVNFLVDAHSLVADGPDRKLLQRDLDSRVRITAALSELQKGVF